MKEEAQSHNFKNALNCEDDCEGESYIVQDLVPGGLRVSVFVVIEG